MAEFEFSRLKEGVKRQLNRLCSELGVDAATFYFYDKSSNQFFFPVSQGLFNEEDFERGIPNMNRPLGQVAQKSREVFAEDVNVSGLAGPFSYNEKVVSLAALPLHRAGDVFGAVFLNYRQAHFFSEEEQTRIQKAVQSFASDIIRVTQRVEAEELAPAAITKTTQQIQENTILQDIANMAAGALEDSTIIIWLPKEKELRSRVTSGENISAKNLPPIGINTSDPVARAFKQGKSISVGDARKAKGFVLTDLRKDLRWRAMEAIPIQNRQKEILGVMAAYATVHLKFTLHEKAILRALAESAAYNLENEKKIDSLNALHALGTRLTLPLNLKETLSEIVASTPRVIGADICTIHLYNAAKQEFEDVDKSAVNGASIRNMNKPGKGGLAYRVIDRTWIISENVPDETFDASSTFVRQENVRAYAGVSLHVVNEPVGVMFLSYRQPHRFSVDERTLLRTISFYAATAIYVAKLFEQRDVFADIAREIAIAENRQELLRTVLHRSLELLGSEYGAIGLVEAETSRVKFEYAVGTDLLYVPAGEGLVGEAIASGLPVRVGDVAQDRRYIATERSTVSEMDIPLMRAQEAIGVLNVETTRKDAYTEEHEKLAVALATHTMVALDKIALLEQTRAELNRRVTDIEVLQEVYGALETAELEDGLANVVTRTLLLTEADYGAIYLLDRSTQEPVLFLAALPEGRASKEQRQDTIPIKSPGILPYVVNTGQPYRCNDVKKDDRYFEIHEDTRSELIVPLVFNNRVYGAIDLESKQLKWFNEREERLVQAIAGAAAAAVRQVHLFEDLEEVNRLSEQLNSTTFNKVQEVLELIHNSANKLMDTNNMYIALYDDYSDVVRFGLMYELGKKVDVETDPRYQPRKAGQGITEEIIRTKKPIFHPTGKEHGGWYKQEGRQDYSKLPIFMSSWIGVPMLANDKVIGVVATYHPSADYVYSRDDSTSLQAMANQAAIAISNVRLAQQRQLREMGQLLSANIYLAEKELLEIIYKQTSQLMDTKEMYVALYDKATDMVRFGLAFQGGKRADVETDPHWQPRRAGSGRTEWIIKNKAPLFHPTGEIGRDWYARAGRKEYIGDVLGCWVGVPMIVGDDQVVGVISVWHPDKEYAYDGHDLGLLQTLADTAASALNNARRYRESQAQQELAALGTAMSAIQHRINNTLNIVSPNVTRLRKRVHGDPETQEILDIIDRNVSYTSQMIHRIQAALRGERQVVNINSILHEVAHQAEQHWQTEATGPTQVILDLDDAIPNFEGPIGQISELFTNLANNACRAMAVGGTLKIQSKMDNNIIYVRVIDTGTGISSTILARLFSRPVPTKETGGTSGLGLYLGALITQSLGGNIEVEDTGPNGATMLVRIPLPRH